MTKKIAVINDLSGFGKCSLTAAISVIAAMGVQPCPLPTAILSAQTGYDSYFLDDYTDKMEPFFREWEKMGAVFDGIYTGFMAGSRQIEQVFTFLDIFYKKNTFLLVDPVMGDNGEKYAIFTPELLHLMKQLALRADIITPNLTELCLLTDTDHRMIENMTEEKHLLTVISQMARNITQKGPKAVIVTGIQFLDEADGIVKMGNLSVTKTEEHLCAFPYIGGSYSGTGDIFASAVAAGTAKKEEITSVMEKAGAMIECAMRDAVQEQIPRNDGVEYEKYLWMLKGEKA